MLNNLPEKWIRTSLGEIVIAQKGKKPNKLYDEHSDGCFPYILIKEMEGEPIRKYTKDPKVPISNEQDILIVWDGSIGKTTSGIKGAIGSTITALTPIYVETKYLECFLRFSKPYIEQTSRGSSIQHINPDYFWPLKVPLAPLNEQRRIVAKLEKLLAKVDKCKERLEKIPVLLKRFRQSVLIAACSGALTSDWRKKHTNVESAKELINKIQHEREKKYKKECENAKTEGRRKPKRIDLSIEVETNTIDFDLPEKWLLVNLNSICIDIVDCPHSTPKWVNKGKICLRTTNFKPNQLDWSVLKYVSDKTYEIRVSRLKPSLGDILYSREGGILGVACILNRDVDICLGQRMMLIRPSKYIANFYITYLLNSPVILKHVYSLIGGSASPHVNVGDIKKYPIPLPPFEEQKEIVLRVEALFKVVEKMEARYQKANVHVEKLTQSILAKAFRGELVPQDPSDPPGSEILKQIKAEREKQQAELKSQKNPRRKAKHKSKKKT